MTNFEIVSLVWIILGFLSLFLLVIAWFMIINHKTLSFWGKIIWILDTLIAPVVGPVLFFISEHFKKNQQKINNPSVIVFSDTDFDLFLFGKIVSGERVINNLTL